MSTIVYQDILQSCFDSQIIETTTLKLKIPSSIEFGRGIEKENNIENVKEKCNYQVPKKFSTTTTTNTNLDLGGWSCLQNLSNISKESGNNIYVHPLSKKCSYSSRLSEKSLQLCTESLGSETGTDIIDTNIFSFSSSYSRIEKSTSPETTINDQYMMTKTESSSSSRNCKVTKRSSSSSNNKKFPPPLTTIRGLNSVQFKPHREDGRLIIKAIEAPLTHNYLQAERSNGRLRLCFFKNEIAATADTSSFNENEELDEIEDEIIENDIRDEEEEEEEEIDDEEEEIEEEEEREEENDMYKMKWDIDGNKFDVEGEMGKEKCQRLSRCKESGKGNKVFCDWKPLWVATS